MASRERRDVRADLGFRPSDEALALLAQLSRGGAVEIVETYTSADLAVLVVIEQRHWRSTEQDWSLHRVAAVRRHERVIVRCLMLRMHLSIDPKIYLACTASSSPRFATSS